MNKKFILIQLTGLVLLSLGMLANIVLPVFASDTLYMTHGIAGLMLVGLYFAARNKWEDVARTSRFLVGLGLLGTVIGFRMALSGISPGSAGDVADIQPMVSALVAGMGTAISTTIVGLIGSLWLRMTAWIIR